MNTQELNSANKELNRSISLVKLSINSQNDSDAFDTSSKSFLLKLYKYLNFEVKEELSPLNKKNHYSTIAILEEITQKIYIRDFKSAEGCLDKLKLRHEAKNLFSEKIKNFVYNTEYLSIILSIGIISSFSLYILRKYSLLGTLEGLNLLIYIFGLFLAYSIFGTIKKVIKIILDKIFSLIFEIKENNNERL